MLHVSQPGDGGVGHVVLGLIRSQRALGWVVSLACPPGTGLADGAAALGARVAPWPATRPPGPAVLPETVRLRRLVAAVRPDLVHLHSAKAGLVGRLVLRGRLPTVYSPHGWSFHAARGSLRTAVLAWERAATRWADRVLCVSEDERRTGTRMGIRATWDVVDNGVDPALFPTGPHARAQARVELDLPSDVPLVVCVGRLSEAKGQDLLLAAWPAVRRRVPTARLVLVGDGPLFGQLAASAPSGVDLIGTASPQAWYAAADVVVVPSRWEGMALAPLEAMATARSVVAFDVDGLPTVLRAHRAVVRGGDLGGLGAAMVTRLTSDALRVAEEKANLEAIRSRYDLAGSTAGTLAVYRDVLAARRRQRK